MLLSKLWNRFTLIFRTADFKIAELHESFLFKLYKRVISNMKFEIKSILAVKVEFLMFEQIYFIDWHWPIFFLVRVH